jgi:hypothetical protein
MLDRAPFLAAGQEIANHPFLRDLREGTLPLEKLERYFSARLQTGPGFVNFLSRLAAQAREQGFPAVERAVQDNHDEEMGIDKGGRTIVSKAHHEWRRWFRDGITRVMAERGMVQRHEPPPDFLEVNGYPQAFAELNDRADIRESMGALAVFEQGLGDEYAQVLPALRALFPGLTKKELVYMVGHVHHEGRHFDEAFRPLSDICTTPAHEEVALRGANIARRVKMNFLDGAYRGDAA